MTPVFVDTVGLLALWDASDQWHAAASSGFAALAAGTHRLYTTTFVLLECGNAAARRPYRNHVDAVRMEFEQAQTLIVPTDDDWRQAWTDYRQNTVIRAGIVDYVSFIVMRRLRISFAFTNDKHFQSAGFQTLF